jgi:CspA family cold shock protein
MTARETGTVKWFNEIRGEGRISRGAGKRDVSVHYSDIEGEGFRTLRKGQWGTFSVEQGIKRPKATHVRLIDPS